MDRVMAIISYRYPTLPCKLHNAVLTTVTFLRVLSYNYSSFPLSPRLQSTATYLHNTCPNTHIVDTRTEGIHLCRLLFLASTYTKHYSHSPSSLSVLLLHYATAIQPFCDIKDDTTATNSELWLEGLTQHCIGYWCTYLLHITRVFVNEYITTVFPTSGIQDDRLDSISIKILWPRSVQIIH